MSKFLDSTGLGTMWAKIKSTFQTLGNLVTSWSSTTSDTKYPSEKLVKTSLDAKAPNAVTTEAAIASGDKLLFSDSSDSNKTKRMSTGFLPIANGGTGATTKKAAEYAINGGVPQDTAAMQDYYQIVFAQVGSAQNATNGVFLYRTASTVWNYMKDKMSSDSGVNISGNAATATSATTATNFDTSGGTIKSSLESKVNIASDSVLATSEYHWDIISQVASIASRGIHYKRWICNSDGTSAFVDYRPNSDNASFMLEAYAIKWNSYEDCKYKLVYWHASKKTPYVAELIFYQAGGLFPQTITWYDTGVADSASKLTTARKTYVTLGTASTSTTRDWSGDTTIPVDGTLGVGNGGTGKSSVTANNFLVGNGTGALVEKTPSEVRTLIGAGTSSLTIGSSSTQAAAGDHKHGTMHVSFTRDVPNQDDTSAPIDNTWLSNIGLENSGFWLKSLLTRSRVADWLIGGSGAGIAFGGGDTKGIMTIDWDPNLARVRFAGGNGDSARWYWTLRGTSGKVYTLPSDTCSLQAALPTTGTASTTYAINVSGNAATATTATNYDANSGTIKTTFESKLDIAPVGLSGPNDLLTLVKSLGANNIRYRRWCCASSGASDNIGNRPNSDQSAFMLEAFATRRVSESDYQYELIYYKTNTPYPYLATITQSTTSISWVYSADARNATSINGYSLVVGPYAGGPKTIYLD